MEKQNEHFILEDEKEQNIKKKDQSSFPLFVNYGQWRYTIDRVICFALNMPLMFFRSIFLCGLEPMLFTLFDINQKQTCVENNDPILTFIIRRN